MEKNKDKPKPKPYKPGYLKKRSEFIIKTRKWSIGFAGVLITAGYLIKELQSILKQPFNILNYGYFILLPIIIMLIFLWIWATQKELNLLFDWLDPEFYEPPSGLKETAIILWLAFIIVMLVFTSRRVLLFGIVFTIYSITNLLSTKYLNYELREIFRKSKQRIDDDTSSDKSLKETYLKGIEILEFYFIKRSHIFRLYLIMFFSFLGLIFSMLLEIKKTTLLGVAAYCTFILTIIISEIVIYIWRAKREEALRPLYAVLNELLRIDE